MRRFLLIISIALLAMLTIGASQKIVLKKNALENKEVQFLDLKLKKELSDKKLTLQRKYTLAVLAARELKQLHYNEKSLEFYKIAREIKIDENKTEIYQALEKNHPKISSQLFYYEVNLKSLIKTKSYDKALLSLNPESFIDSTNTKYKIIYDLLNVRLKKRAVKKLYCLDDLQKNPEDYQYSNLLCEALVDFLRDGKIRSEQLKSIEDYFFKHDLKESYLLQLTKELKGSL